MALCRCLIVSGRVQAVGYRAYVKMVARNMGIKGSVKNLDDGTVEIYCECPNCGAAVSCTAEACPECGEEFVESEFRCPSCGATVSAEDTVCPNCGEEFGVEEEEVVIEKEDDNKEEQNNGFFSGIMSRIKGWLFKKEITDKEDDNSEKEEVKEAEDIKDEGKDSIETDVQETESASGQEKSEDARIGG